MKRLFVYCFLFFQSVIKVEAQVPPEQLNFASVDSFVTTIKYRDDYIQLAKELTQPYYYENDAFKTRAIFKWITNNIEFDYRFVNSGREITEPECERERVDCSLMYQEWEHRYIRRILKSRKAIADGYARLFKKLCDLSNVQCEMTEGYARTKAYQVGNNMPVNHTWNVVLIDTAWYYVDATWASGYCTENDEGRLLRYVKQYDDYYWMARFEKFSRNHYPKKGKFVEPVLLTREQFFNKPFYYSSEILKNITERTPATGVLKVKKGDTIRFGFTYMQEIGKLQINSNIFRNPALYTLQQVSKRKTKLVRDTWAEKKQQYVNFSKKGNDYQFFYVVKEESLYYLELVFDYKPAIRYRVRFEN